MLQIAQNFFQRLQFMLDLEFLISDFSDFAAIKMHCRVDLVVQVFNSRLESHTVELIGDCTHELLGQHTIDAEYLRDHLFQFVIVVVDLLKIGIVIKNDLTELLLGLLSQFSQLLLKPTFDVIDNGVYSILASIHLLLHL
jgi:hypothetical protein